MMVTTPKENPSPSSIAFDDPRYPIWGRLFMCKVARITHYSTKYLEEYGLHSTGNRNVDLEMAKQPSLVYITINDMVELFHQNQTVSIVKQEDIKLVYEYCQDYTFDWANKLDNTIYKSAVPLADLVKIDEFAEAVYQYAGHQYGEKFARSFLSETLAEEVMNITKMFEAVDKKIREGKKAKDDAYTVKNKYSQHLPDRVVELDVARVILPERPSMRDMFLAFMGNGDVKDRF